jgi:hypothetical protein
VAHGEKPERDREQAASIHATRERAEQRARDADTEGVQAGDLASGCDADIELGRDRVQHADEHQRAAADDEIPEC